MTEKLKQNGYLWIAVFIVVLEMLPFATIRQWALGPDEKILEYTSYFDGFFNPLTAIIAFLSLLVLLCSFLFFYGNKKIMNDLIFLFAALALYISVKYFIEYSVSRTVVSGIIIALLTMECGYVLYIRLKRNPRSSSDQKSYSIQN
jgi:hypothetical protein